MKSQKVQQTQKVLVIYIASFTIMIHVDDPNSLDKFFFHQKKKKVITEQK